MKRPRNSDERGGQGRPDHRHRCLFRDSISTTRSQVPVLGDIPIAGVLFRGTKDTVKREEVIIMLTPHIVKEAADTNPEKRMRDCG